MSEREDELVFETVLDAPSEKVWRALNIPEFRDRWLQPPADVSVELEPSSSDNLLTFRWSERNEESRVTIELTPQENGQTGFRLTHAPLSVPAAANSNESCPALLMRAA